MLIAKLFQLISDRSFDTLQSSQISNLDKQCITRVGDVYVPSAFFDCLTTENFTYRSHNDLLAREKLALKRIVMSKLRVAYQTNEA